MFGWFKPDIARLKARGDINGLIHAMGYEDLNLRMEAMDALGDLAEPRAIDPLIEVLKEEDYTLRMCASNALRKIGAPAVPRLVAAFHSRSDFMRATAVDILARIGAPAIPALIDGLKDLDPLARLSAVRTMEKINDPRLAAPLAAALKDSHPGVRASAARGLGHFAPRGLDDMIAMARDPDLEVRKAVAESLGQIRDLKTIEPLIALLQDADDGVRSLAAESLERKGKDALPSLLMMMKSWDHDVRHRVVHILGRTEADPRSQKVLLAALSDHDQKVRQAAAEMLIRQGWQPDKQDQAAQFFIVRRQFDRCVALGAEQALPPLLALLEDSDPKNRTQAAEALGRLGSNQAIAGLVSVLIDMDPRVRLAAVRALGMLKSDAVFEPLVMALSTDGDARVRAEAARSLGNLADIRGNVPLKNAQRDDRDAGVLAAVAAALQNIESHTNFR